MLWAFLASQVIGLILVGLLHIRDVQPEASGAWPYGFSGLVPLRASAVFGTLAYLIWRQRRRAGLAAWAAALLLIAWSGFGVIWNDEQLLTETLLELAAGGLIVFGGAWWLEGFGPGVYVPPAPPPAPVP